MYFYLWVSPLLARGFELDKRGTLLCQDDLLELPADEDPQKLEVADDASLFSSLLKANRCNLIAGGIFRILSDGAGIAGPFILRELVAWLTATVFSPATTKGYEGFLWAVGLCLNQFVLSLCNNASIYHSQKAFCNMRSVVALRIYKHAQRLPNDHRQTGGISQMHASDSNKFVDIAQFFHQIWSAPIVMVVSLFALYQFIGWAGVLSIGVILLTVPIQGMVMRSMVVTRMQILKRADKRIGVMSEILQGIRIVKFMGWEKCFISKVEKIRDFELELFGKMFALRSAMLVILVFVPSVVSFFVFSVAYKGFAVSISPESVFPSIAMLNVLRQPLTMLPVAINRMIDLRVSMSRIEKFLSCEVQKTFVRRVESDTGEFAVEMNDVSIVGDDKKVLVGNVSIKLPRGKLSMIAGGTGSGKSLLINAMVGECQMLPESSITIRGSTAFLPQDAWIMNATLRENILMGLPFDNEKYLRILNACQLIPDLKELPASDFSEIGERGINLSGGQKQRVSFARAAYSDRDVVILDDPLSAVDAHVCSRLFEECIQEEMKQKTRVLVTHQVQFLPRADHIVLLEKCKVVFQGTYDELLASKLDLGRVVSPKESSPKQAEQADNNSAPDSSVRVLATEIPLPKNIKTQSLMTVEHRQQGSLKDGVLSWYFQLQGIHVVVAVFITFALWRVASVISDLLVSWWSTRTKVLGNTLSQDQYLLWYGVFLGLSLVLLFVRQVPFVVTVVNGAKRSNALMMERLLHAPISFFDTTPVGRVISRFSKDLEQMDLGIPESFSFFYNLVLGILGSLGLMTYSAPYLIIIVVVVMVGLFFLHRYYMATNRALKRLESANRSPMSSILSETLSGLATIRAYGMSDEFAARHLAFVALSCRSLFNWRNSQRWLSVRVNGVSNVVTLAMSLLACGLITSADFSDQQTLLPALSLGVTYAVGLGGTFAFLTTTTAELEAALSSVERVKEFCDDLPQERSVDYGTEPGQYAAPDASWPATGNITFENVAVRYREKLPLVLENVSFAVKGGQKIGVVGRTGSGKSTIMLSLFRMLELSEGSIRVDGVNIANVKLTDLRSKITIIPQDPLLFDGTIRSNLDPFDQSTDEAIWTVLRKVHMIERIEKDGRGLDCSVAERGANFSVGQRQLLCLARALLKGCKVLLLDEATASVDYEADAMIQRTICEEFGNCTVLTIAHRLATVIDADRICVLDHGKVVEFDSPSELIEQESSLFRSMVKQLGDEQFEQLRALARTHSLARNATSQSNEA